MESITTTTYHGKSLPLDLLETARGEIANVLANHLKLSEKARTTLPKTIMRPSKKGVGDLTFPLSPLQKQGATVEAIQEALTELTQDDSSCIESFAHQGAHMGVTLKVSYTSQILSAILKGDYLSPLKIDTPQNVMIEYSQPNTHKAFHVGHMRNVALGDCLVRLQEQCGHSVIAANYYGDEGAHVAKCLWRLKQELGAKTLKERDIPVKQRGEYLGQLYKEAVEMTSLSSLTTLPCFEAIVAKVMAKEPHPKKPDSWNVCSLDIGTEDGGVTVVCGGTDYNVGDLVAYMPVGATFQKKLVAETDMMGVTSSGVMLSYSEACIKPPASLKQPKSNKKKKKQQQSNPICIIATEEYAAAKPGMILTELGRLPGVLLPENQTVAEFFATRQQEVGDVLKALEAGDKEWCALWDTTKQWSLDEFKSIYGWLGARFDVDFYESQVSEPSMKLVKDWTGKVFEEQEGGAIGVHLQKDYNLPFLMVVKSNGSGLYATKDLALAQHKFKEHNIDKSVYVVDKGQSLHFQQVFATLDKMGFAQAKNSFHLAYGQVVRPEGKMSSRAGTVIYFSQLQQALTTAIDEEFLNQYKGVWPDHELTEANRAIAVGTIRYGMLNIDPDKDITFELQAWIAKKGNTGPYLMYAYARIKSILQKAAEAGNNNSLEDMMDLAQLLTSPQDRFLLVHMSQFWPAVMKATTTYKPNGLCKYLYVLAQEFMSWYEASPILKKEGVPEDLKRARLVFVQAVAAVLKTGLGLLGMTTLERM